DGSVEDVTDSKRLAVGQFPHDSPTLTEPPGPFRVLGYGCACKGFEGGLAQKGARFGEGGQSRAVKASGVDGGGREAVLSIDVEEAPHMQVYGVSEVLVGIVSRVGSQQPECVIAGG